MFWKILSAFAGIPREHGFITKAVQEVLKVEIYDYKDHQNLSIPFHFVKGVGLSKDSLHVNIPFNLGVFFFFFFVIPNWLGPD